MIFEPGRHGLYIRCFLSRGHFLEGQNMQNMIYVNTPDELTFVTTPDTSRKDEETETEPEEE